MDRHTPLSPGPIKSESLPTGFNELMQHNAAASYAREAIPTDSIQAHSQPTSRYGTPVPQSHHSQGYDASIAYQQHGYHPQAMYSNDNSPYGPIPDVSRRWQQERQGTQDEH